jgi:hypothetical protein
VGSDSVEVNGFSVEKWKHDKERYEQRQPEQMLVSSTPPLKGKPFSF